MEAHGVLNYQFLLIKIYQYLSGMQKGLSKIDIWYKNGYVFIKLLAYCLKYRGRFSI